MKIGKRTMKTADKKRMHEKIKNHGTELLRLFGEGSKQAPVKLCKALRRLERQLSELHLTHCNRGVAYDVLDDVGEKAQAKVNQLLPGLPIPAIVINRDPRGYALKIDDEFMRDEGIDFLYRDWGGYGILAPDFSE